MGLFSFTQELAIDLGTANTIIIHNDKMVVDEPSVVALDRRTDKLIAVGEKARQMHGKTHDNIRTIHPLRDGVIADFYAAEQMLMGFIRMINKKPRMFPPSLKMVVCIPSGSTEVEIRAVRDSSEHAGGREVYLIFEPMAAALGMGFDVEAPEGHMIVDIGGGTTEIAVISLGGIVANKSVITSYSIHYTKLYDALAELLEAKNGVSEIEDRKWFAGKAFGVSSHYDSAIFNYFNNEPGTERISLNDGEILRYGENPHQSATVYKYNNTNSNVTLAT